MGHAGLNLLVDVVRQQASVMAFNDVTRGTAIFAAMALFLLPWFHSKKRLRKAIQSCQLSEQTEKSKLNQIDLPNIINTVTRSVHQKN